MISLDGIDLTFSNMGLFVTEQPWTHPTRMIDSYELIYVLNGNFHIKEGDVTYYLQPNTALFLHPNTLHGGLMKSIGEIKFYWLHFHCSDVNSLRLPKLFSSNELDNNQYLFQELMTQQQLNNKLLCDIKLAELLTKISAQANNRYPKLISEIIEYIRINAKKNLSVDVVSTAFRYNNDYVSKLFKKAVGISLHSFINQTKIKLIKSYLLNTNLSIKELSGQCGFEDENNFVKFFKYHTQKTPTEYRSKHNIMHLNDH